MKWLERIFLVILTVFLAVTFTFLIIRWMPGDPIAQLAMDLVRQNGIPYEQAYKQAAITLNYDPNVPILTQYVRYISNLLKGDLGQSMTYRRPVIEVITSALPWTLFILSTGLLLSFVIGVLLGMYIAWKRNTILDPIVSTYASIANALPDYIVGMILIIVFAANLRWFPTRGAYDSSVVPGFNASFIANAFYHAVLPVAAYVITGLGGWALTMKGNAMSVLGEDYITAARARGLRDRRIITTYVGRNAMLPLITSLALSFAMMFGGSPLVENIFVYPGIGYFFNQAIGRRDYALMQGLFLLTTIAVVLANLVAELLYSVLDPRVR